LQSAQLILAGQFDSLQIPRSCGSDSHYALTSIELPAVA
jgi:hypothetical protein